MSRKSARNGNHFQIAKTRRLETVSYWWMVEAWHEIVEEGRGVWEPVVIKEEEESRFQQWFKSRCSVILPFG
jgi:hypothetical protein